MPDRGQAGVADAWHRGCRRTDGRHVLGDAQPAARSTSIAPRQDRSLLATNGGERPPRSEDSGHRGATALEAMLAVRDQVVARPRARGQPWRPGTPAVARRCRRPGGTCRRRTRCPGGRARGGGRTACADPAGIVDDHPRPGRLGSREDEREAGSRRSSTYCGWAADRSSGTMISPSVFHGPTGTKSVSAPAPATRSPAPAPSAATLIPAASSRSQPRSRAAAWMPRMSACACRSMVVPQYTGQVEMKPTASGRPLLPRSSRLDCSRNPPRISPRTRPPVPTVPAPYARGTGSPTERRLACCGSSDRRRGLGRSGWISRKESRSQREWRSVDARARPTVALALALRRSRHRRERRRCPRAAQFAQDAPVEASSSGPGCRASDQVDAFNASRSHPRQLRPRQEERQRRVRALNTALTTGTGVPDRRADRVPAPALVHRARRPGRPGRLGATTSRTSSCPGPGPRSRRATASTPTRRTRAR